MITVKKVPPKFWLYGAIILGLVGLVFGAVKEENIIEEEREDLETKIDDLKEQLKNVPIIENAEENDESED